MRLARFLLGSVLVLGLTAGPSEAANILPVITVITGGSGASLLWSWTGMAGASDTAVAASVGACHQAAVSITGTFGTTTISLQGALDGATFANLNDAGGTAINAIAATAVKGVREMTNYVKPVLSGGNGTALRVDFLCIR